MMVPNSLAQHRRPKFEPKLLTMRVSNLGLKFGGPTSGREWQTTFHVFTHTRRRYPDQSTQSFSKTRTLFTSKLA